LNTEYHTPRDKVLKEMENISNLQPESEDFLMELHSGVNTVHSMPTNTGAIGSSKFSTIIL